MGNAVIVEELLQSGTDPGTEYSGASPAIRALLERYHRPSDPHEP
jgi:hypothetical protein